MSFEGVDFYDVDGLLSEEELAVRDMVREWVQEELMPVINEHYMAHTFPKHLIPQMGELGFFGANLPEEYGCAGLNNVAYGLINQELERGDSGLRSFASVQGGLVMYPIFAFGSEEQRKEWLPKLASGEKIGCFGLTEPDFGSNPGGMLTRAVRDGDEWVLNGSKMWITNGSMADVAIIGPRPVTSTTRHRSAASSSRRTATGSRRRTRRGSCPSSPRTPASWCCRTFAYPTRTCCRSQAV